MEETNSRGDTQGNLMRQSSLRPSGSLKSTFSGRVTPRNSPSFRRLHSSRTPRKESRAHPSPYGWIRSNRLVPWLVLIAIWGYLGFHVQSRWAHHEDNEGGFIGYGSKSEGNQETVNGIAHTEKNQFSDVIKSTNSLSVYNATGERKAEESTQALNSKRSAAKFLKNEKRFPEGHSLVSSHRSITSKKTRRSNTVRSLRSKRKKAMMKSQRTDLGGGANANNSERIKVNAGQSDGISRKNTSYGLIVGPFGKTEDTVLGWNAEKLSGTCDREGEFARSVWGRSFVLIFHELSMTGAPLSMMELATELLSCGGTVSVVVLSKKGGLMGELSRRGIKVLNDKADFSYKVSMKADLVIAGSAVCASWIEQYLSHFEAGSSQIVWWIMENRRAYFNRSKHVLNRVKMLIFLSDSQSKQWLAWCQEEHIQLSSHPELVPLSVNDDLAFVAGIPCSLNTPSFSVEKMLEKRRSLREAVRKEMGLSDKEMLVMTLSSINPGKGQFYLLQSALLTVNLDLSLKTDSRKAGLVEEKNLSSVTAGQALPIMDGKRISRALFQSFNLSEVAVGSLQTHNELEKQKSSFFNLFSSRNYKNTVDHVRNQKLRKILTDNVGGQDLAVKVLIGSIGSKSNKELYIKGILRFLSQHTELSKIVLWTPATTRVASLYAAADVYVINAQGLGETFGRVTIEAMAFGLPVDPIAAKLIRQGLSTYSTFLANHDCCCRTIVQRKTPLETILGTDAGGTQEIVEHNVTGLLHPLGREGVPILTQNLDFLLKNPSAREQMGMQGRNKVEKMFMKHHMYERLAKALRNCMKIKQKPHQD